MVQGIKRKHHEPLLSNSKNKNKTQKKSSALFIFKTARVLGLENRITCKWLLQKALFPQLFLSGQKKIRRRMIFQPKKVIWLC